MSIIHELAEIIGPQHAVRLGQTMGGARFYIPARAANDHPLTLSVGQEPAQKICDMYSGDTIEFPSKRDFRRVRDNLLRHEYHAVKLSRGCRADVLAMKYGLSRRQVLNIVNRAA